MATFGDTTAGAASFPYSSDRAIVRSFPLSESATLNSMTCFFDGSSTAPENFKFLIYADAAGAPGALLATSSAGSLGTGGTSLTCAISGSLSAGTYWLGSVAEGFTGRWAADLGVAGQRQEAVTYATPAATFGTPAGSTSDGISIYVTYTPAQLPVFVTQPQDQFVASGATPTLVASVENYTTLQWYESEDGKNFVAISGATSLTYTTPALTQHYQGRQYRLEATGAGGAVNSRPASIGLTDMPVILWDTTVPTGNDVWLRDPILTAGSGGITAVAADTVTFSDSAVAQSTLVTAGTDTVAFSDSAVSQTSRIADATDTVTFSDSAVSGVVSTAVAADSVSFTDSAAASLGLSADASDTVSFSDSATAISSLVAAASDTVAFTDSAAAISTLVSTASDTVSFSDSAVAQSTLVAAASDTVSFTDSGVASISTSGRTVVATDTVSFSDSAVAQSTLVAAGTDTVSFTDSATAVSILVATGTDTVSFSDSATAQSTLVVSASDTVAFTDSAAASVATGIIVADATDSVTFSDSAVSVKVPGTVTVIDGGVGGEKRKKRKLPKTAREEIDELLGDVIAKIRAPEPAIKPAPVQPKVEVTKPAPQIAVVPSIPSIKSPVLKPVEDDEDEIALLLETFF